MNEKVFFAFSSEAVKKVRTSGAMFMAAVMGILFLTMFIPRGAMLWASLCLFGACWLFFAAELVFEMVLTAKSTAGKLTMGTLLALLLASVGYLIYKTAALAFL